MDTNAPQKAPRTVSKPGESIFLAVVLLGLAILLPEALKLPGLFQGQWAGPGSLAQLLLVAMALLTGSLLLVSLRTGSVAFMLTARYLFSRDAVMLLLTVVLYTILIVPLGFEISTFAFLLAAMYVLNPVKPLQKAAIAFATVAVIYAIFVMLFEVILP